jgi:hypothetical protein
MFYAFYAETSTLLRKIPKVFKFAIAALLILSLYGCTSERSVIKWLENHPETMERIDTTVQKNRVYIKSEVRQANYGKDVLQYNPYKPGDSLVLKGGRFITTVRNVGDRVLIQTRFDGVDTTFITTKTVYKFPNVWIEKYNKIEVKLTKRTNFLWGVVGGLALIIVLLLFLIYLLARSSIGPTSIFTKLLGLR